MHRRVEARTRRLAREQRDSPTLAEDALWRDLRGRRCDGLKFRRQTPIGTYVVDFVCLERRLIVELDGRPHDDPAQRSHDQRHDSWLQSQGFRILRFPNDLILGGASEIVLAGIQQVLTDPSSDLR